MAASAANDRLFAVVSRVAASLGLAVVPEFRAGASDANFIAAEKYSGHRRPRTDRRQGSQPGRVYGENKALGSGRR